MAENFIVTTIRKPDTASEIFAEELATRLGGKFIVREDFSFDTLKKIHGAENILLVKKNSVSVITAEGEFFSTRTLRTCESKICAAAKVTD